MPRPSPIPAGTILARHVEPDIGVVWRRALDGKRVNRRSVRRLEREGRLAPNNDAMFDAVSQTFTVTEHGKRESLT